MSFSVLMGVYKKDDPGYLKEAIDSILNQTKTPEEIYIVKDGPLTDKLDSLLNNYVHNMPKMFTINSLAINAGLGNALKLGVLSCRNELIARMDSDDISKENRFEYQLNVFNSDNSIDIVGGAIEEFALQPGDLGRIRTVPLSHKKVLNFSKYRSPVNHVTAMYKKSSVIRAGNYESKFCGEDYDLWLRMLITGSKFQNLSEVIVDVRVGNGMIDRRRGMKMFRCEKDYLCKAYHKGHFTTYEYCRNILIRFVFRSLPSTLIHAFYRLVRVSNVEHVMHENTFVIIGAPRSGTNMLRDLLTEINGVETWKCDEINYIWRHGNIRFPSDEFSNSEARPEVKNYINKQFSNFKRASGARKIIEKTCASSLRVDFINEIIPGAKYIFIIRDGLDVIGSAKHRWTAPLDFSYIVKKLKYVPLVDIPFYGVKYLYHRMYKIFSKDRRLAYWGPTLPNMGRLLSKHSLLGVCALQWKACLNKAEKDLKNINPKNVYSLRYESFVKNPKEEFLKLSKFLDENIEEEVIERIVSNVSTKSIGKGRKEISKEEYDDILPLIKDDLERLGYDTNL